MLEIQNICGYRVSVMTGDSGGSNRPNVINLGPGDKMTMMKQELKSWTMGPRQSLSRYVQMSSLSIIELDSVHVGRDMASKPEYTAHTLQSTIDTAVAFKKAWNLHLMSGVHIAEDLVNDMTLADPDTLPLLVLYIAAQQGFYSAHILSAGFHVAADTINSITPIVASDLLTSIAALKELFAKFEKHKRQVAGAGTPPLTPAGILIY